MYVYNYIYICTFIYDTYITSNNNMGPYISLTQLRFHQVILSCQPTPRASDSWVGCCAYPAQGAGVDPLGCSSQCGLPPVVRRYKSV